MLKPFMLAISGAFLAVSPNSMAATFLVSFKGKMSYEYNNSYVNKNYTSYFVLDLPSADASPLPSGVESWYAVREVGFDSEFLSTFGLVNPFTGPSQAYDANSKYYAFVSFNEGSAHLDTFADLGAGNFVNYQLIVQHTEDMTGKSLADYFTPDAANPHYSTISSITWPNFTANSGPVTVTVSEIDAVPEPASWAMMIGGFAIAGGVVRRRSYGIKVSLA